MSCSGPSKGMAWVNRSSGPIAKSRGNCGDTMRFTAIGCPAFPRRAITKSTAPGGTRPERLSASSTLPSIASLEPLPRIGLAPRELPATRALAPASADRSAPAGKILERSGCWGFSPGTKGSMLRSQPATATHAIAKARRGRALMGANGSTRPAAQAEGGAAVEPDRRRW